MFYPVTNWKAVTSAPGEYLIFLVLSLLVAYITPILVKKCKKLIFLKPLFGALLKIGDWIWKYVQIRHCF